MRADGWDCETVRTVKQSRRTIDYPPLCWRACTGIYLHTASQYHARPKACKRAMAIQTVHKFPYARKQTKGNEFTPCSNDVRHILKCFCSFKISAITFIWLKSSYEHSVTQSHCSGKESGLRSWWPLWRHQWRSLFFIYDEVELLRGDTLHFIVHFFLIWHRCSLGRVEKSIQRDTPSLCIITSSFHKLCKLACKVRS